MEITYQQLAKVLGADAVECYGPDVRFAVHGSDGAALKVSIEGHNQRFMAVLTDAAGVTRCSVDIAPVSRVVEAKGFPGRVTLLAGQLKISFDSKPTLAVEIESD
jgi:hypothetical protein